MAHSCRPLLFSLMQYPVLRVSLTIIIITVTMIIPTYITRMIINYNNYSGFCHNSSKFFALCQVTIFFFSTTWLSKGRAKNWKKMKCHYNSSYFYHYYYQYFHYYHHYQHSLCHSSLLYKGPDGLQGEKGSTGELGDKGAPVSFKFGQ